VWPDDLAESAFLAEAAAEGAADDPQPARPAPRAPEPKLPQVEALVPKVPEGVRAALDELFRAKFTKVRRFAPVPGAETPP
jgi:hypothetical protein